MSARLIKVGVRYCVRHEGIANDDDTVCDFHGHDDTVCVFRCLYRRGAK